ncbi:hypothetical protein Nit79A3_0270 [Nitrosomonas sp. Is79A3]
MKSAYSSCGYRAYRNRSQPLGKSMADSTLKCNFCKEVYRQAAVVSELLKRPSKRSADEALQAAYQ